MCSLLGPNDGTSYSLLNTIRSFKYRLTKSSNILSKKSIFEKNEVIKDNPKMRILCNEQNLLIGMNIGYDDETENRIEGFCKDYFNIGPFTNVLGTNDDNINTYSAYWNVIEQIKKNNPKRPF